jgi:beta-lactamase class A
MAVMEKTRGFTPLARGRALRRGAIALAAVCALVLPSGAALSSASSAGAQSLRASTRFPTTKPGAQAAWIVQAMAHLPVPLAEVRAHFDTQFLSQVPPAQLNSVLEKIGPVTVQSVPTSEAIGLAAVLETKTGTLLTMDVIVDSHGLVRGLLFQPLTPAATSWAQVDHEVRSVAPKVAMVVASVRGKSCTAVHGIDQATPMPLGSAFKLYVLDALAQQIASGKLSWIKPVTVTSGAKSLPSGELQNEPNGTRLPVETVASDMISISDNTAADMLIDLVGRSSVEAALKSSGAADPALDVPFLTTRELFVLKLDDWPVLAQRYLALPANKRLSFLGNTVDRVPISALHPASWTTPRDVGSLEWFASPNDICRVFAQLAALARQPKLGPIGPILETNNGDMALDSAKWRSVWFKGGSEPGVLTLNYMATTTGGQSYVVSVLAENPAHTIGPTATGTLIRAIKGAFQLAAR